jgi:hypothetical protein
VIAISVAFILSLMTATAITARWSSARARRRMAAFLSRVAALPSIETRHRAGRAVDAVRPPTEARLYFLDAYRGARVRRARAAGAQGRMPRSVPTLSFEHPRPARGA